MDTRQVLQALQEGKIDAATARKALLALRTPAKRMTAVTRFPELVLLNRQTAGRPVFWLHGSGGGVEVYNKIAAMSARPFYGIQARGWQTDRQPLQGIQAMAAAYVHAIMSLQPAGPYDLGGFSLGGTLAYEMARQLQELGETVNTIVLVDVLQLDGLDALPADDDQPALALKQRWWQTVNLLLTPYITQLSHMADVLIHQDALDWTYDDDVFIENLITRAGERGVISDVPGLKALAAKSVAIQEAFETERYIYHSLPRPDEISCYYLRNRNGHFLGHMLPYFSLTEAREQWLQQQPYWEGWKRYFPHFHLIDVSATNHMVMLSEAGALDTVKNVLSGLYTDNDRSGDVSGQSFTGGSRNHSLANL